VFNAPLDTVGYLRDDRVLTLFRQPNSIKRKYTKIHRSLYIAADEEYLANRRIIFKALSVFYLLSSSEIFIQIR